MRWSDRKKRRLEDHLARIVEAIFQFGAKLKEERLAAEERRRRLEEWHKERAEKLRPIAEEEQRLKRLDAEVEAGTDAAACGHTFATSSEGSRPNKVPHSQAAR